MGHNDDSGRGHQLIGVGGPGYSRRLSASAEVGHRHKVDVGLAHSGLTTGISCVRNEVTAGRKVLVTRAPAWGDMKRSFHNSKLIQLVFSNHTK